MGVIMPDGRIVSGAEYAKWSAEQKNSSDPPPDPEAPNPEDPINPEAIQELMTELEGNAAWLELLKMQDAARKEKESGGTLMPNDQKPAGISDEGWAYELELRRQRAEREAAKVIAEEEKTRPFDTAELIGKTFADLSPDRQAAYRRDLARALEAAQKGL